MTTPITIDEALAPTPVPHPAGDPDRPVMRRSTTRRPPVARGTVAIGATAAAGTVLAIVTAAAGPMVLVATAAGAVLVPLAVWRRRSNSRTGRRSTARRQRGTRERRDRSTRSTRSSTGGGRSGGSLLGAGSGSRGGAGRRSTGRSVFGVGAGSSRGRGATGARSGGLLGGRSGGVTRKGAWATGSSRRSAAGGSSASRTRRDRAGRYRRTTPKVKNTEGGLFGALGGVAGRPAGGKQPAGSKKSLPKSGYVWSPNSRPTPKKNSKTGKSGNTGGGAGRVTPPGARPGAAGRTTPSGGKKAAGNPPTDQVKKVKKNSKNGLGPVTWSPNGRTRRRRAAQHLNHGVWKMGSAFAAGVRKPTSRAAFAKAYRRYGQRGYQPTVTGFMGRVVGGVAAAVPAWLARLAWVAAKKLAVSVRAAYSAPKQSTAEASQQSTIPIVSPGPAPVIRRARVHAPPPPAFTPIIPTHKRPPVQPVGPRPRPSQVGASSTGGNRMGSQMIFPAHDAANDFWRACANWYPQGSGPNNSGAIWDVEAALPLLAESIAVFSNSFSVLINNCERTLEGGLTPGMRSALVEVWNPLQAAATQAQGLPKVFADQYATQIANRHIRGGQTLNV